MPPRVAILGWGSLLWEGGSAFDKWHDDWRCDGPILNLEFSRVSASRLNALTLVIDRDNGVPNRVAWCLSLRDDPALVHADLRSREGTTVGNIGRILLAQLDPEPTDQSAADIAAWARTQALDAVVWTRLSSNFESATKVPFSVDNAQAYLRSLPSPSKAKAAEYLLQAPEFINTPVRIAVKKERWFLEHAQKSLAEGREKRTQQWDT
jgi:hypothetical protein